MVKYKMLVLLILVSVVAGCVNKVVDANKAFSSVLEKAHGNEITICKSPVIGKNNAPVTPNQQDGLSNLCFLG